MTSEIYNCPCCTARVEKQAGSPKGCPHCHDRRETSWFIEATRAYGQVACQTCGLPFVAPWPGAITCSGVHYVIKTDNVTYSKP